MEINPNFSEKAKVDFVLVQKALEGDQAAYSELMTRYKESIFFMLLKMVNNREDAMDLTIETFGKAFENIEKYKPEYSFSTWLFKIGTNNCIDFIRKKKMKTVSIDETYGEDNDDRKYDPAEKSMNPEDTFINKQKSNLMHTFVEKLSPRYRQLVVLRYFEEKSYEEISAQLDLPLGTIKAQLFRARDLLYNMMKRNKEKL